MLNDGTIFFYIFSLTCLGILATAWVCEKSKIFDEMVLFSRLIAKSLITGVAASGGAVSMYMRQDISHFDFYIVFLNILFFYLCFKFCAAYATAYLAKWHYVLYERSAMRHKKYLSIANLQQYINGFLIPNFPKHTEEVICYFIRKCSEYSFKNNLEWRETE